MKNNKSTYLKQKSKIKCHQGSKTQRITKGKDEALNLVNLGVLVSLWQKFQII
jgi:hypothetical protein